MTITPKPALLPLPAPSSLTDCLAASCWTGIRVLAAAGAQRNFPPPSCALCSTSVLRWRSLRLSAPTQTVRGTLLSHLESRVRTRETADTLAQTQAVFAEHHHFYNHSRPNQSKACGNRPLYTAFPSLPVLPHLPTHVDPDAWLLSYHNQLFRRHVMRSGRIQIDNRHYYISRAFAGRHVDCRLDAYRRVFDVLLGNTLVKVLPFRGLYGKLLEFGTYLDLILKDAAVEQRRLERKQHVRGRRVALMSPINTL